MHPDLALLSIVTGLNYPCLELIFMVTKVFEPLKFDCTFRCSFIFHVFVFVCSVELQCLAHLWNHETMFEIWVVRADEN